MKYCSNPLCKKEMEDSMIFCSVCGHRWEPQTTGPVTGPGPSNDSSLNKDERLIMQSRCFFHGNTTSLRAFPPKGKAMLTNNRFIFLKKTCAKTFTKGALINVMPNDIEFDIPLNEIANFEYVQVWGINNSLFITTKSGNSYHLVFDFLKIWAKALQIAIDAAKRL